MTTLGGPAKYRFSTWINRQELRRWWAQHDKYRKKSKPAVTFRVLKTTREVHQEEEESIKENSQWNPEVSKEWDWHQRVLKQTAHLDATLQPYMRLFLYLKRLCFNLDGMFLHANNNNNSKSFNKRTELRAPGWAHLAALLPAASAQRPFFSHPGV